MGEDVFELKLVGDEERNQASECTDQAHAAAEKAKRAEFAQLRQLGLESPSNDAQDEQGDPCRNKERASLSRPQCPLRGGRKLFQ